MAQAPISDGISNATFIDWSQFWQTFHHGTAVVDGLHLHYVEGGKGPPILLLPCCWPQNWYAWRFIMPQLVASGHRVVVLDPRGVGDSDRPTDGYDLKTLATDIHGFVETIGLLSDGPISVAAHGIGTWLAYAYAADWRNDVKRLAVMNACVPGISTPRNDMDGDETVLQNWHFSFNRLDDLPELLIGGREREFITWLFRAKAMRPWAIDDAAVEQYVRHFSAPGALRAINNYYRTIFNVAGVEANRRRAERPLEIPILALGAERGYGDHLVEVMRTIATDVSGGTIVGSGHYMLEEDPIGICRELIRFIER
ncbi:alpha/beta hydrolase [Methylobacterium sp. WL64]|uniref:alpha/beta fold hydrolase n=1 Tax=Methylobacterium sp. WL64 TaxID=2603894 RepID=UPI0011C93FCA|nr:alpha/beta hydrolase [Methylobacterium sp. WL64]TXM96930.1 alpha/beta hydrolase [Methylobacterium sp. WL64]